jgi:hypothetical protein
LTIGDKADLDPVRGGRESAIIRRKLGHGYGFEFPGVNAEQRKQIRSLLRLASDLLRWGDGHLERSKWIVYRSLAGSAPLKHYLATILEHRLAVSFLEFLFWEIFSFWSTPARMDRYWPFMRGTVDKLRIKSSLAVRERWTEFTAGVGLPFSFESYENPCATDVA